jgi:hypothetical protein
MDGNSGYQPPPPPPPPPPPDEPPPDEDEEEDEKPDDELEGGGGSEEAIEVEIVLDTVDMRFPNWRESKSRPVYHCGL